MRVSIDKTTGIPLYCQLADLLERKIRSGELREGERLPSERDMCAVSGASRDTVKRAYRELERRGSIITGKGSGSYVKKRDLENRRKQAERICTEAVERLRFAGLSRHETEYTFLELMWNRLPEAEKLKVAWVDCSAEILNDTARDLERDCNIRVTPFLLEEAEADPGKLAGELTKGSYDLLATTINHLDDLQRAFIEKTGGLPDLAMEKVVLAIDRMTVSQLAKIAEGTEVAAFYETEWYRSNMERFLDEFSVSGKKRLIRLEDAMDYLSGSRQRTAVILPQDPAYHGGLVGRIGKYCAEQGIFCIIFRQTVDNGSLLHFRKRLQKRWLEEGQS